MSVDRFTLHKVIEFTKLSAVTTFSYGPSDPLPVWGSFSQTSPYDPSSLVQDRSRAVKPWPLLRKRMAEHKEPLGLSRYLPPSRVCAVLLRRKVERDANFCNQGKPRLGLFKIFSLTTRASRIPQAGIFSPIPRRISTRMLCYLPMCQRGAVGTST